MGYHRAGFEIVGVDIKPQKNYPFEFHQADAFEYPLDGFDAIHCSPPCQRFSATKSLHNKSYPDLIAQIREILQDWGGIYVIENVVGAPLIKPIMLCGSSFGLGVWRHRLFESNVVLKELQCQHKKHPLPIDVTGTGGPCLTRKTGVGGLHRKPQNMAHAKQVMQIDWMTRKEITQSIPPAYTKYIGLQLMLYYNTQMQWTQTPCR